MHRCSRWVIAQRAQVALAVGKRNSDQLGFIQPKREEEWYISAVRHREVSESTVVSPGKMESDRVLRC